jgi:hypothetical protein
MNTPFLLLILVALVTLGNTHAAMLANTMKMLQLRNSGGGGQVIIQDDEDD